MRAANLKHLQVSAPERGLPVKENLEGTIFPDGTTCTADMDYEELERFTDPENAKFDEALSDAKKFREEKGLFWDEINQPSV